MQIAILLQLFNEQNNLHGWFDTIAHINGPVIILDDGSTDGSVDIARAHPRTTRLLSRYPATRREWNETVNRRILLSEAWASGADWILAIDADERIERRASHNIVDLIEQASDKGRQVISFHLREMWGGATTFRADGLWGVKRKASLFKNVGDAHIVDSTRWHGEWFPLQFSDPSFQFNSYYNIYHLKMMNATAREMRMRFYKSVDPSKEFQPIGYDYMCDDTSLQLETIHPEATY